MNGKLVDVMQANDLTAARCARMRWNTPLSEEHAGRLLERLDVGSAPSVLDLGCGWGELLLRVVEASGRNTSGVGVDTDGAALDRGRRRAHQLGLGDRVSFVEASAAAWEETVVR